MLDFQFNHNQCYSSTVEHAESRLLRRLFQIKDVIHHHQPLPAGCGSDESPDAAPSRYKFKKYSEALGAVTIYTSLESCAQCSGIMALARLKDVFYLQPDPSMYCVGRTLCTMIPGLALGSTPTLDRRGWFRCAQQRDGLSPE